MIDFICYKAPRAVRYYVIILGCTLSHELTFTLSFSQLFIMIHKKLTFMLYECRCFWTINLYVFSSFFDMEKSGLREFFPIISHNVMFPNAVSPLDLQVVIQVWPE